MKDVFSLKHAKLFLFFLFIPFWVSAQTVTIKGTIKDVTGETLIGVSVVEKGTTNGTTTDIDGNYTLSVPSNATLDFSYVGYTTQSVPVNGRSTINIVMEEDVLALGEVVVIGYGTQRKSDVTGSIASVSESVIREVPAGNITQALQGRLAGVEMSQTSSKPGAEMQIRVRGTRSLNASNDPLVVLDGIPFAGSIGDIDPNSIKSIDILKDASATAIYGSRGANGVILVSTNRGVKGSSAKISYNGYQGIRNAIKYPMMESAEYVELRKAAKRFTNSLDESDNTNTDWQDLLYRKGTVSSHDISITGGTQEGQYSFGTGYYNEKGVIPTQQYSRFSLRATLDQNIGKYFRFGIATNSNYNINEGDNVGLYNILSMTPLADPYNADGSWKRTVKMPQDETWLYTRDILKGLDEKWINHTKTLGTYNNMYAEVKIPGIEGLKFRVNAGLNFRLRSNGQYTGEGINSTTIDTPSTASIDTRLTTNWAVENLLTYDRSFGKHQVNVVGMYSAEETLYNRSNASARNVPADHFQYFNLGQANSTDITINPSNQDYRRSGLMSWMGRAMYSYDNHYMLSVTLRSDGSSRLAPGYKWHTYPAVSAGWNLMKESFMSNVTMIDMLKIRVGYGQTSNQAVDPYSTLGRLTTRPYNFGSSYATGVYVSELPNPNLGWEYSKTWNFGVDFSLFNSRLTGNFEYYIQKTVDLLYSLKLPPTSGVKSYMANIGKSENKGFELSLNYLILDNVNGWTWDAGINLYVNRNKITELASGQKRDEDNRWFVDYPIDVLFDYEKIGLWQEGDPYRDILEPGGNAGMIKVKYAGDYNADGSPTRAVAAADRQIMSMEPNFQGGFNTRVTYKNFDLSMVGAFKNGGVLISTLYSSNGYLNMMTGRRGNVKVDYWTPENTGADFPNPAGLISGDNPKYGNTLGYFSASYLKIRTITLGYSLSPQWLETVGIEKCRIYATVQNPFVLFSPYHKLSGLDPEPNSYGDENVAVRDGMKHGILTVGTNSPSTRNFLIGINLIF